MKKFSQKHACGGVSTVNAMTMDKGMTACKPEILATKKVYSRDRKLSGMRRECYGLKFHLEQ